MADRQSNGPSSTTPTRRAAAATASPSTGCPTTWRTTLRQEPHDQNRRERRRALWLQHRAAARPSAAPLRAVPGSGGRRPRLPKRYMVEVPLSDSRFRKLTGTLSTDEGVFPPPPRAWPNSSPCSKVAQSLWPNPPGRRQCRRPRHHPRARPRTGDGQGHRGRAAQLWPAPRGARLHARRPAPLPRRPCSVRASPWPKSMPSRPTTPLR